MQWNYKLILQFSNMFFVIMFLVYEVNNML